MKCAVYYSFISVHVVNLIRGAVSKSKADPGWPRGLKRGSAAARQLVLQVRIPPREWMSVSCECCVL